MSRTEQTQFRFRVTDTQLATLMGGALQLKSLPGSVFEFTCSLGACRNQIQRLPSSQGDIKPPMRILLAEDNKVNELLATRLLSKQGHDVTAVATGCDVMRSPR